MEAFNMLRIRFIALFFALMFCAGFVVAQEVTTEAVVMNDDDNAAYSITVDPMVDTNPVKTQHTMVATVYDRNGNPLPNQRVEWILARTPNGVGDIVEHDDMNAIVGGQKIVKLGNQYSVTYTNNADSVLTFGNDDPKDDIHLTKGQTWLTITSPVEGTTHIIAFCPNIKDASKHKVFALKHWFDAEIGWPEDAVNKVGTPHTFSFKLIKASTGTPLVGYKVRWELLPEGVPAHIGDDPEGTVVDTETNDEGIAEVVLNENEMVEGYNRVKITLMRPTGELLAVRTAEKRWVSPRIMLQHIGPREGILGEKVTYTITVSNPGAEEANDVVLTDTLPAQLDYLECSVAPTDVQGKLVTWNIGTLPMNETRTFTVTTKAVAVGEAIPVARVDSLQCGSQEVPVTTIIGAPDLYLIIEGPDVVRRTNPATYNITVKNTGNAVAKNVNLVSEVPAGMSIRGNVNGVNLRWRIGNLESGQSVVKTYTLDTPNTGIYTNKATVFLGRNEVHKAECNTKVIAPDLKLTKQGDMRVFLNKPTHYTITVANEGDAVAYDMVLVDTLPEALEYVNSSPRGTLRPGKEGNLATVTWKLGDIQPGQVIEIQLQTRANAIDSCKNVAKLFSNSQERPAIQPLEASCETTIMGVPAMHINSYDTEDPVEVGKQTIYVIEVVNEGTSPCTNVTLTNHIDDEMEYVSANGVVGHRIEDSVVYFEPVPILQPAEKVTYRIVCKAVKEGSAKNTAKLKYDQFNKEIIDEEGTSVYK